MTSLKTRELIRYIEAKGYYLKRMSKHIIYSNGTLSVAIPHDKVVSPGTLRDVLSTVLGCKRLAKEAVMKGLMI